MNNIKNIFVVILFLSFAFCFGQNTSAPKEDEKLIKGITDEDYNEIFTSVQVQAVPPGGMNEYRKFVAASFRLPEVTEKTNGTVIAKFIVWNDGSIRDIVIVKESHAGLGLGKEAYRILLKSPKWTPAQINGKNVKQYYTLPISIEIVPTEKKVEQPIEELKKAELPLVADSNIVTAKDSIQVQPEPLEGFNKFYMNLQNRINVPESAVSGRYRTIVSFVVEKDGTLSDYKIVRETPNSVGLGEEVIRVLKTFPKWKPCAKNTRYMLPVTTVVESEPEPATKKE